MVKKIIKRVVFLILLLIGIYVVAINSIEREIVKIENISSR